MDRSLVNKNTTPNAVMKRQSKFLEYYAQIGSISGACRKMGISKQAVLKWKSNDMNGFREQFEIAESDFADKLHEISLERIMEQKPSHNPTLLIAALNAHHPKYRASNEDKAQEGKNFIAEFSKFMKEAWDDQPEVIDAKVVEEDDGKLLDPKKE
tara:strand:+ start:218 stop:682 length:465 start_codon:yes stop_codon:yes gene_type:complete